MHGNFSEIRHSSTMFEAISRRWAIAGSTAMLVFCITAYIILGLRPLYTSQTTLILPFTPVSELASRNDNSSSPQSDPLIIHSYIQIMKDDGLCLQVIRDLHLADKPEFDPQPNIVLRLVKAIMAKLPGSDRAADGKQDRVLQTYKKRLQVYNDGRSLAVDLSFQAEDPTLAAAIANAHAEDYVAAQVRYRRREAETKTEWMEEQVQKNAKDLRVAMAALQLRRPLAGTPLAFAADDSADFKFRQAMLDSKKNVYEGLLNRQQIMLAEQQYDGSDTRILSPARPALRPSYPNKALFGGVALVIAFLAGAAFAWVADLMLMCRRNLGDQLRDLDLDRLVSLEIPRARAYPFMWKLQRLRLALYWEKIREVRSSFGVWPTKGLVLAVTPVGPKETASIVAASLARALAASGVRTLLLDLDLRHPRAHTFFGMELESGCGLAECLGGDAALKDAIRPAGVASLSLLSSSARGNANIDMLSGPGIKATMSKLRREYKAIIMFTPPSGFVCDSLVIADLADEIVLVSDGGASAVAGLAKAVSGLRRRGAMIRGLIVTSYRQAKATSCRELERYSIRDELSIVLPLPVGRNKRGDEVGAAIGAGVLQAAE